MITKSATANNFPFFFFNTPSPANFKLGGTSEKCHIIPSISRLEAVNTKRRISD